MDTTKISKAVKSWLYADMHFKPEEMVMERPIRYGGLGVLNVKYKAMAGLTLSAPGFQTYIELRGGQICPPLLFWKFI